VTVVAIPSQKAMLMCPYVSSGKFLVLAPRCSRSLLHNLQPTSDRCLIFASHLATGMILLLPSFLAFHVSKGRTGLQILPQERSAFMFPSAVNVPYPGWLTFSCSALACAHDFKNFLSSIQVFCYKTFTMLWYYASYRCLCAQSSMSSPLHHLSYRRQSVPTILISYFPCLAAQKNHVKTA